MKKLLSLILSLALLVTLTSTSLVNVSAAEAQDTSSIVSDENVFIYDTPDRSKYQLSQEQLDAPTEVLIEYILDYPYLVDLYVSNISAANAYNSLCESYNGLAELETRQDAASVLVHKFAELAESSSEDCQMAVVYLHTLLSVPSYCNRLTAAEAATYIQASECCGFVANNAGDQLSTNATTLASVAFTLYDVDYVRSSIDAYTTRGVPVPLYTALDDHTDQYKDALTGVTSVAYGVKVLGDATTKYNCHSYAWYQSSVNNVSWINDVEIYIGDEHCTKLGEASVGAIAVYYDGNEKPVHSAIVTSIDGNDIICQSKWGPDGLFEHEVNNVPPEYKDNGNDIDVTYYRYTRTHSRVITIDNTATHTLTCTECSWESTEAHVENTATGKCKVCGLSGPFTSIMKIGYLLPDDKFYLSR